MTDSFHLAVGASSETVPGSEIALLCALKDREAIAVNLMRHGGLNKHHARRVADAMLSPQEPQGFGAILGTMARESGAVDWPALERNGPDNE